MLRIFSITSASATSVHRAETFLHDSVRKYVFSLPPFYVCRIHKTRLCSRTKTLVYVPRWKCFFSDSIFLTYIFHTIVGSHAVQWFFAGVSITAVVFVWLLLPETHGKKLSEIEEYFQNHFLAVGAEAKTKKRRAQRKQQRIDKSATEPLNPKTVQNV